MSANEQHENEAAREPEDEQERQHAGQTADGVHEVPLFLRDSSDGQRGNAQDEKDGIGE